ncbi:MAG: YkvA family protein [Myxococcota bacterium]|nr:YkvA family protein [Myxococcota bacterium]
MSDTEPQYLDTFPTWLRSLGEDAEKLGTLLSSETLSAPARESIAGGLNYLFKSLDLIPDGIDDIGYLDDAFVLRVAADLAAASDEGNDADATRELAALANDCELLREFLGKDYTRLETYVKGLRKGAARGRSVGDILGDAGVREDFLGDVRGFASTYQAPSFSREEKNLIKLRAFFDAKLPK